MKQFVVKYRPHLVAGFLCLLASILSYFGNSTHQLLQWDDIAYVSNNSWITNPSWEGFTSIFFEFRTNNWHPLTWLSYIPEYYLCGDVASCYKATNIVLHSANSFLVFILTGVIFEIIRSQQSLAFNKIKIGSIYTISLITAILFAVHPQHAESVIWVAERKDLLYAFFYLLALIFYLHQPRNNSGFNLLPFAFFILAILSKSMAITLPIVLILFDGLLLDRFSLSFSRASFRIFFRIAVIEKIHYHIVVLFVILITLFTQSVDQIVQPSIIERLAISLSAIEHYLFTFIYPFNYSPFYPVEIVSESVLDYWMFTVIFFASTAITLITKQYRLALLLVAYFLITLSPVIGIIKVGDQAFAERYTYLPMLGFYMLTAYWISRGMNANLRLRSVSIIGLSCLVIFLMLITHQYKNIWRDDLTLWSYIEQRYPDISVTISNNLGYSYYALGDYQQAKPYFETAIDIDANRPLAYSNLANVYRALGNVEQALETYRIGVANNPDNPGLITSAGFAFMAANQDQQASDYYFRALEITPNFPPAMFGIGNIFYKNGDLENAISILEQIPSKSAEDFQAKLLLAQAYAPTDKGGAVDLLEQLRAKYGRDQAIDAVMLRLNQL